MSLVKNILQHLNKTATKSQQEDFNLWLNESTENKQLVKEYEKIWSESDQLDSFKQFDVDQEWDVFMKSASKLDEEKVEKETLIAAKPPARRIYLRRFIEIAAAAVLACIVFYLVRPKEKVSEPKHLWVKTTDTPDTINMVDGSTIYLAEYSEVIIPATLEGRTDRKVLLKGNATFDVVENDTLLFNVESYKVGIDVTGTEFNVDGRPEVAEVENFDGEIKFFEIANPENVKILYPGDKFKFEGGTFTDMVVAEIPGEDIRIDQIFNYLDSKYEGRIASGSNLRAQFQPSGIARVDLDQPLRDILLQLDTTADFSFRKTPYCGQCFEILKFRALSE